MDYEIVETGRHPDEDRRRPSAEMTRRPPSGTPSAMRSKPCTPQTTRPQTDRPRPRELFFISYIQVPMQFGQLAVGDRVLLEDVSVRLATVTDTVSTLPHP